MTREEAINRIKDHMEKHHIGEYPHIKLKEAFDLALVGLRPVSREQVEKVWRGEWQMVSNGSGVCSECHRQDKIDPLAKFCRYCGVPMTDEAVDMMMERMEALHDKDV